MKVRLPLMIQDPVAVRRKGIGKLHEFATFSDEPFFLDGPVTERIAVLSFDEKSGELIKGVPFVADAEKGTGEYVVSLPDEVGAFHDDFIQASVLGTVLKTMSLAENERVLGRKLKWAFDAPQLLVIPRAGEWQNAYYERDTHSLQFFFFDDSRSGERIYTALSRDIVAHETAHAILDGVAPDLYDALTPQSLAIHEAFADITAVLMAINSRALAETVMRQTNGSLSGSTAFNRIAEQFGSARSGRGSSLRDLSKHVGLNDVFSVEPHELSVVLSSALYELLVKTFDEQKARLVQEQGDDQANPEFSQSGLALFITARQIARMLFRALDYLPPGEISFADYGRAIYAADRAAYPDGDTYRHFLCDAFVSRGIVADRSELETPVDFTHELREPLDLLDLVESDWVAYKFANQNRDLLNIPDNVTAFEVLPRLETEKKFAQDGASVHDIVFAVAWEHIESNDIDSSEIPPERRVTAGTSLIINAEKSRDAAAGRRRRIAELRQVVERKQSSPPERQRKIRRRLQREVPKETLHIRARLTSDLGSQKGARDRMLRHLLELGLLAVDDQAVGPDGESRATVVQGRIRNNVLKVGGTARMLHIATAR